MCPPKRFHRTLMKGFAESEQLPWFDRTFCIEPPPFPSNPLKTHPMLRKPQKTRKSRVQEVSRDQSWISCPSLIALKHNKTSVLGAFAPLKRRATELWSLSNSTSGSFAVSWNACPKSLTSLRQQRVLLMLWIKGLEPLAQVRPLKNSVKLSRLVATQLVRSGIRVQHARVCCMCLHVRACMCFRASVCKHVHMPSARAGVCARVANEMLHKHLNRKEQCTKEAGVI